ncbi:MAG: Tol biopolymer transport system component/imidazolonepropionase-like amidohydrolase [Phenylobacterium sp.]|jgi:Tol biopolymer transport system component/imidazolonepropionase-like amidohydrolase
MSFNQTTLAASVAIALLTGSASLSYSPVASAHSHADAAPAKAAEKAQGKEDDKKPKWDVLNPPGAEQTITIDTTETTWSNLDVSPDGKTIIFDMLGDLYSMPIKGGEAKALTSDMAWNFQPKFSPDGKTIAFISDRKGGDNLWLMDADGTNLKQVSKEKHHLVHNPYWNPDGNTIVVKQNQMSGRSIAAGSVWIYHKSGGKGIEVRERLHGKESQKNIAEPAYSADGRYVFYSVDGTSGTSFEYNKNSVGSIFEIRRWDLQTGEEETIIKGAGGAARPTPSHDGKQLAYIKRIGTTTALYVKNLKSGVETQVYFGLERDMQESFAEHGVVPSFSWTPDDEELVFWQGGKFHSIDVESKKLTNIPVHLKVEKQITPALRFAVDVAPESFKVKMARWTQVSPDGKKVMFQALGHIYIRDIKSGKSKRLTKQKDHFEFYPSFSRDGKKVVYTTWDDGKLGSVRVVKLRNGKGKTISTEKGHYIEPTFSPDGKKVLFKKVTGGFLLSGDWSMNPGLYIADSKGGDMHRISQSGSNAHFAADTKRVYFSAGGEGNNLLFKSTNLNGKDERTHFKGDYVTDYKVSPDGQWIAFTQHFNTFVAPFIMVGKSLSIGKDTKSFPVKQVSKRSGDYLNWAADSSELTWAFATTLYRRPLTDTFAFLNGAAADKLPEALETGLDISFDKKADAPKGLLALVGGRVVTMRNAENEQEVIEDGVVLIENNRIKAVGKRGEIEIPSGAKQMDIRGKTVIPGLVDAHAHGSYGSYEIQPQQNWNQYSNLAFGVTTIHDPSNNTSEVFSMSELGKAGMTVGPRIQSVGRILYAGDAAGYKTNIDNQEDAKFHIQRLKDSGAISVKSYNHPRRETRQQVIAAARELDMMVVPEGGGKFQHNMNMIIDGHTGVEHALPVKNVYSDVKQMWSQTKVGYTPTFVVAYGGISGENYWYQHTDVWKNERLMRYVPKYVVEPRATRPVQAPEAHYNHIDVAKTAKQLRDEGVKVHIGAHGQREGLAAHWELWSMAQGGFSGWEAIRGGTIDGAAYLGMDKDIGSIEVGKLADMAIIDGDPTRDIRQSEFVSYTVINGRIYDTKTMNEVGNYDNKREEFFFEQGNVTNMHPATAAYMEKKAHTFHWKHH